MEENNMEENNVKDIKRENEGKRIIGGVSLIIAIISLASELLYETYVEYNSNHENTEIGIILGGLMNFIIILIGTIISAKAIKEDVQKSHAKIAIGIMIGTALMLLNMLIVHIDSIL